jgi:hypothetical protein
MLLLNPIVELLFSHPSLYPTTASNSLSNSCPSRNIPPRQAMSQDRSTKDGATFRVSTLPSPSLQTLKELFLICSRFRRLSWTINQ